MPFKNATSDELLSFEQVKGLPEYAGILSDEAILVDVDDMEQSVVLLNTVETLGLKCRVYATSRGKHFLFKNIPELVKNNRSLLDSNSLFNYYIFKSGDWVHEIQENLSYDVLGLPESMIRLGQMYSQFAVTYPQYFTKSIVVPTGNTGEPLQQTIQIGGNQPEGTASEGSGDMNITVNVAPPEENEPQQEPANQQAGFSMYQVCVVCLLSGILIFLIADNRNRKKD